MNIDLSGRTAFVSGSTKGIGRAIAEGLARAGFAIVINGREAERVTATVRELERDIPGATFTGWPRTCRPPRARRSCSNGYRTSTY